MSSDAEIATNLLTRLLAGERGNLSVYIALLLEKASPLRNSDDHYAKVLPRELANVRLGPDVTRQIIGRLCSEVSRNPDAALIAAISTTGVDDVTVLATDLLANPPRPLTITESGHALGIAYAYLPAYLSRNPDFLSREKRSRLISQLRVLAVAPDMSVRRQAELLLKSLT